MNLAPLNKAVSQRNYANIEDQPQPHPSLRFPIENLDNDDYISLVTKKKQGNVLDNHNNSKTLNLADYSMNLYKQPETFSKKSDGFIEKLIGLEKKLNIVFGGSKNSELIRKLFSESGSVSNFTNFEIPNNEKLFELYEKENERGQLALLS